MRVELRVIVAVQVEGRLSMIHLYLNCQNGIFSKLLIKFIKKINL